MVVIQSLFGDQGTRSTGGSSSRVIQPLIDPTQRRVEPTVTPTPTPQPRVEAIPERKTGFARIRQDIERAGEAIRGFSFTRAREKVTTDFVSAVDDFFRTPDVLIEKAQTSLRDPENKKVAEALAEVQTAIEPIFEKNQFIRGVQQGISNMYLGSSQNVANIYDKPIDNPVEFDDKIYRTAGEITGGVLSFLAGGVIVKGLNLGKLSLPILFVALGQTSADTDTTVTQRMAKAPVDAVAGFLLSKVPVAKKLLSKETLKGTGVTASIFGGASFVDSLIEGLSPEEAGKVAIKMGIIGGLFHIVGTATGILIRSQFGSKSEIMSPKEARDRVLRAKLEKSKFGKDVMRESFKAEQAGKNLEILVEGLGKTKTAKVLKLGTQQETRWVITQVDQAPGLPTGREVVPPGAIEPVAPQPPTVPVAGAVKAVEPIVEPKAPVDKSLAKEASKYTSAEDFFLHSKKGRELLREQGIKSQEAIKDWFNKNVTPKEKILDNLNPTGTLLTEHDPQSRMKMKLGENITTLDKTSGEPANNLVTIYRGVPEGIKTIVPGDFISTNRELAKSYTGTGNVISKRVKMSDVLDDRDEPLGEEYIYRPKSVAQQPVEPKAPKKVEPTKPVEPKVPVKVTPKEQKRLREARRTPDGTLATMKIDGENYILQSGGAKAIIVNQEKYNAFTSELDKINHIRDLIEAGSQEGDTNFGAMQRRAEAYVNTIEQKIAPKAPVKPTQKEKVKKAVKAKPKTIKEIAKETKILEPNVRRIVGIGAKEGTFERVERGVYILSTEEGDIAYIHTGDAIETLPKLAKEGLKADMVFLDIPYKTPAVTGGNRGINYATISPDQFRKVVKAVKTIARDADTPIYYMYSKAKSGLKKMLQYNEVLIKEGLKPLAEGSYTKFQLDGVTRVRNMRGEVIVPEGIILLNQSGKFVEKDAKRNLDFKIIRPRGYQTEKPALMLDALVLQGTKPGDVVLDPFAGSGVALAEAVKRGRIAVGIEISKEAVEKFIKPKLKEAIKERKKIVKKVPVKPKVSVVGKRVREIPSVKIDKVWRAITNNGRNLQLPILTNANVVDGQMQMTDLEISTVINTNVKDGLYQVIGEDLVPLDPKLAEDFPDIPKPTNTVAKSLQDNLVRGIKDAFISTSKDEARPILTGIRFEVGKNKIRLISTDGFRLYNTSIGVKGKKTANFTIGATKKLNQVLNDITKGGGVVDINYDKKNGVVSFANDNGRIVVKTIVGDYPVYEKIFPQTNRKIVVPKHQLTQALKDIAPYAKETANVTQFRIEPTKLIIKAENENKVEKLVKIAITDSITDDITGLTEGTIIMPIRSDVKKLPKNAVQLNYRFVQDMIKTLQDNDVYMSYTVKKDGNIELTPVHFSDKIESVYKEIKREKPVEEPKKPAKTPSGASQASIDRFADLKNIADREGYYKAIQFPEVVRMVRELLGTIPSVKYPRVRPSLGGRPAGLFQGSGLGKAKIILNPDLFKSPEQAIKTFAHEVGHLADWLPDYTLKRGNLIGHIASLTGFLRKDFAGYMKNNRLEQLMEQKKEIQEKRRELKAEDRTGGTQDKQYLEEIKFLNKEIKKIRDNPKLVLEDVKKELKAVTQLWKPFNEDEVPASFVKYRYSSEEMYADAVSILFNDPNLLKETAPTFWDGFFDAIDKKPRFKKVYFDTMDLLNRGEVEILSERQKDIRSMFKKGEDLYKEKILEQGQRDRDIVFRIKWEIIDKNQRVIDMVNEDIKKGKAIADEDNPIYFLEEGNYVGGVVKSWVEKNIQPVYADLQANEVSWEDFGEALFLERVIKERGGTRNPVKIIRETNPIFFDEIKKNLPDNIETKTSDEQLAILKEVYGDTISDTGQSLFAELISYLPKGIANPLGFDVETAEKQLESLKKQIGSKYQVIDRNLPKFRFAVKSLIPQAVESGLYKEKLADKMIANPAYATFQVLDYLEAYIPASIREQVGTLKEIANPAGSTILKSISTIRAIEKNNTKRAIINWLKTLHPEDIQDARTIWLSDRKVKLPIEPKDRNLGMITVMENGTYKGYYVDPYIASTVKVMGTGRARGVIEIFRFMNRGLFRPLFTTYNLGFQTFNLFRDFMRFYKNVPGLTFPNALRRYKEALPQAKARAWGITDETINEMEEKKILGITFNDVVKGLTDEDKQVDLVLKRLGLAKSESSKRAMFKIPLTVLDQIEKLGNFVETIPKVAGYRELQGKFPDKELASFIRTSVGSPDFLRKGAGYGWYNEVFLYSNAMKEGVRADFNVAFKNPRTRAGWWWKTATFTLLPKLLMFAGILGLFGTKIKKMLEDTTEYDKTSYTIVPLGIDRNDKTVYLRIPQDETGRFIGGFFWKALMLSKDRSFSVSDVAEIMSYTGGQVPNLSPGITSIFAITQFLAGQNPYDFFRGRNVIQQTEFQAGGKYALKPFVTWQLNQLGGGIFWKSYYTEQSPETETWVQKTIQAPLVSNIIGRWIRVSDYGQKQINREIIEETKKESARESLRRRELVDKYVEMYQKEKPDAKRKTQMDRELTLELLGHQTPDNSTEKTLRTNTIKKFNIGILEGEADANMNSLIDANNNKAKVELLKRFKQVMDREEYEELLKTAKEHKIISDNVIKELKK